MKGITALAALALAILITAASAQSLSPVGDTFFAAGKPHPPSTWAEHPTTPNFTTQITVPVLAGQTYTYSLFGGTKSLTSPATAPARSPCRSSNNSSKELSDRDSSQHRSENSGNIQLNFQSLPCGEMWPDIGALKLGATRFESIDPFRVLLIDPAWDEREARVPAAKARWR
jgi:hypothetical protein